MFAAPKAASNQEIRVWYNKIVSEIPLLNGELTKKGVDLEARAVMAYNIRHEARMQARAMMSDASEVAMLQARDMKKYGNANGPSFPQLLDKAMSDGMTRNQAFENIISTSANTDPGYIAIVSK